MALNNLFYAAQELNESVAHLYQVIIRLRNEPGISEETKQELNETKERLGKIIRELYTKSNE